MRRVKIGDQFRVITSFGAECDGKKVQTGKVVWLDPRGERPDRRRGRKQSKLSEFEILACPLCGGAAELISKREEACGSIHQTIIQDSWRVRCRICNCTSGTYKSMIYQSIDGSKIVIEKDGAKDAVDAWNRRKGYGN